MKNMLNFLIVFISAYALLNLYVYTVQDSFVLFPPGKSHFIENIPQKYRITLEVNNVELEGIKIQKETIDDPFTIIYFGGNAEDVTYNYYDFLNNLNANIIALNYRGYAGNPGKASLKQLSLDADVVIGQVIQNYEVNPDKLILMGRSLGGALAIENGGKYKPAGIIAISPFDSLLAMAKKYYSYLPVSLLLKHNFDNVEQAAHLNIPLLILSGDEDRIIPQPHAQKLFEAWRASPKKFVSIAGAGHNDIHSFPSYYHEINKFLKVLNTPNHNE